MLAAFAAWALVLASPPATSGVALLYAPLDPSHRRFVTAMEQEDASIVGIPLDEPWSWSGRPRAVVALGPRADERAEREWPRIPRARLLLDRLPRPTKRAELVATVHPQAGCTADHLRTKPGPWLVLAGPVDAHADHLGQLLGAEVVHGDPAQQRRAVLDHPNTNLWVLVDRDHLAPTWMQMLAGLAHHRAAFVGSDIDLDGLAQPVAIDIDALAQTTLRWLRRQRRSRKSTKRTHWKSPCRVL